MERITAFVFAIALLSQWACAPSTSSDSTASAEEPAATTAEAEEPPAPVEAQAASVSSVETVTDPSPFEQTVSLTEGIQFTFTAPNSEANNRLTVTPSGFSHRNETTTISVEGKVHRAEVVDLDSNGFQEAIVFTQDWDNEDKGNVYVFTSYRDRSYGQVHVKELPAGANNFSRQSAASDYFELRDGQLVRNRATNTENAANGQDEQYVYQLKQAEAAFILTPKATSAQ